MQSIHNNEHVDCNLLMFILKRNKSNYGDYKQFTCTISKALDFLISKELSLIISIGLIYSPTDNLIELKSIKKLQ